MTSLIVFHWGWLFGALVLGAIVGALTWQRIRFSWTDRWVHIALGVIAVAIVVALLKLVHGRPGYWLDLALWLLVPYTVGCFVGWGLREVAETPHTADAMQALAAVRPPPGKTYESYTGPLETTYVSKPGATALYRPGSGIVDARTAVGQSPDWDAATTAKAGATAGSASTAAGGAPLETPYVSKPGQTPLFRPGSGIVDYRTALAATVAKAGEVAGAVVAPAAGVVAAVAAKAKGVSAGSAATSGTGSTTGSAATPPGALADTSGRLGDAPAASLAGNPAASAGGVGATSKGASTGAGSTPASALSSESKPTPPASPGAGASASKPAAGGVGTPSTATGAPGAGSTASPASAGALSDTGLLPPMATSDATDSLPPSPGQTPPSSLGKDAALAPSGAVLATPSTSASPASGVATPPGAGATLPDPPPALPVPNEDAHAGERPKGFVDARGGKADDLKRIKGIGPQNEGRLHGLGIWHFDQIAAWTPDNVKWVGSYLAFHGRIDREKWIEQARALAAGLETEFSKRVAAGKVATSKDDGSLGQHNIDGAPPHTKS